jgi:hypothetical protein
MRRILLLIFFLWMGCAWAQESKLPSCPTSSSYWTDCFGRTDAVYAEFIGELTNRDINAKGILTLANLAEYGGDSRDGMANGR